MSRPARLGVILRFLHHREQDAARALARKQAALSASENLLLQLQSYQLQSRQQGIKGGLYSPNQLTIRDDFLRSMDCAIAEQHIAVAHAGEQYEQQKTQWLGRRTRRRALGRAVTRLLREEETAHRRREQRSADDLIMRRASIGFTDSD